MVTGKCLLLWLVSIVAAATVTNTANANRCVTTIIIRINGMDLLDSMTYLWCNFMVFMFGVSISYPNKIENYEAKKKIKQKKGKERRRERRREK